LWECDFFTKTMLTWHGWQDCFVLVFLQVQTRHVFATPATAHPNAEWMQEQSRAFVAHLQQQGAPEGTIVTRDNDGKFQEGFDDTLQAKGVTVHRLPVRSPNLKPHLERFVGSIERECLDHFVPLGETHLDHLVKSYVEHYHEERSHQGVGNVPLSGEVDAPEDIPTLEVVGCKERLGGVLKHFCRKAA
jgi:putative transposase